MHMKKISIVAIILLFLVAIPQKSVQAADNNACRVTISRKELRRITAVLLSFILLISMSTTTFAKTYTGKNWYKQVLKSRS